MELSKENSDGSSEENYQQESTKEDADRSTQSTKKRSYGCIFCKRGFTNAQALGGHMNIHRKDRAKAKQGVSSSTYYEQNEQEFEEPNYVIGQDLSEYGKKYPVLESQSYNYRDHMYFQQQPSVLGSNPNSLTHGGFYSRYGGSGGDNFCSTNSQSNFNLQRNYYQVWGANLSLDVGTNVNENSNKAISKDDEEVEEEEEIDLELRLGHDSQ